MRRPARHNYRDRRHVDKCVNVTERAVQKSASGIWRPVQCFPFPKAADFVGATVNLAETSLPAHGHDAHPPPILESEFAIVLALAFGWTLPSWPLTVAQTTLDFVGLAVAAG
jgi:hypothetical protein